MKKIIANISRVFTIALVVISAALLVTGCTKSTDFAADRQRCSTSNCGD